MSLRLSSFLFILFCLLGLIFTILSSKPFFRPFCSSSVALLLIPCSVIFHFNYCIVLLCLFFSSSRSFLNIPCIFSTYASHFSPRSSIIFTSLLWILFPLDCLSPLHLVVFLRFYLVPSSGTYISAVSFYLTFFICDFHFLSCRFVAPLVSGGRGWSRVLCRDPVKERCLPTVGRAGSCPSGRQGCIKGCV